MSLILILEIEWDAVTIALGLTVALLLRRYQAKRRATPV
jgi:prolipoprotein diacylglyceryltransferase